MSMETIESYLKSDNISKFLSKPGLLGSDGLYGS